MENVIGKYQNQTFYDLLTDRDKEMLAGIADRHALTFQEFRFLAESARDLEMWKRSFREIWTLSEGLHGDKKSVIRDFRRQMEVLRGMPKTYSAEKAEKNRAPQREPLSVLSRESEKKIHGDCPVASEETVCCNLKTIDVVENCGFGCSYCTIQTFYDDEAVFDPHLKEKLDNIKIDPSRFVHYGSGQSSDSLQWGNRNGILDNLCGFAEKHPNMLLEFKTKSDNIRYFLENEIPSNVVCSWSLNTDAVIENEEHFTASLDRRIQAARKAADAGIAVAFHFHPMVYYEDWERDYLALSERVQSLFRPDEVLFISFGSVTFIKPVMKEIRKRGGETNILQMPLVKTAKGKLSYPAELKIKQFRSMHGSFRQWHEKVFMYLCMEEASIWDAVFGWHYETNEIFEESFGKSAMAKVQALQTRSSSGIKNLPA